MIDVIPWTIRKIVERLILFTFYLYFALLPYYIFDKSIRFSGSLRYIFGNGFKLFKVSDFPNNYRKLVELELTIHGL
jgi:hypothetical protein